MKSFLIYTALFVAGTTLIASGSHTAGSITVAVSLAIGIFAEMRETE